MPGPDEWGTIETDWRITPQEYEVLAEAHSQSLRSRCTSAALITLVVPEREDEHHIAQELSKELAPRLVRPEWNMVRQLAVQIAARRRQDSAERVFAALIDECRDLPPEVRRAVRRFVSDCLDVIDLPQQVARELAISANLSHLDIR